MQVIGSDGDKIYGRNVGMRKTMAFSFRPHFNTLLVTLLAYIFFAEVITGW